MKYLILCVALIVTTRVYAAEIQILDLVGRNQMEVVETIGEAKSCNPSPQGINCYYPQKNLEIVFIDERADWLTVDGFKELAFNFRAIAEIGLKPIPALVTNPFRMHWQYHQGLEVVSVYGSGKNVAFIQVRAFTPQ